MAPKKGQKMSLNEFLGDSTLGSWADEMDNLPTAPAPKTDGDRDHPRDRDFGRSDREFARPDRPFPPREEVPIPTQPPYTAFVGNLAFDLTETELEGYFGDLKVKSAKIIRDRDEKPKGFGYVEFADVEGLKAALLKTGSMMASRTIRVSVAEPPKERERDGKGGFGDDKFQGNWRRDGPLPERSPSRGDRRSRFDDGPRHGGERERVPSTSQAEDNHDWRSNRPARASQPEADLPPPRRRSGFSTPDGTSSPADTDQAWQIGSRFKPSAAAAAGEGAGPERRKFGSLRSSGPEEPSDWRSAPRRTMSGTKSSPFDRSPSNSTPPTPQLARRKLELAPKSTAPSAHTSPLSSPKSASHPAPASRSNPFGTARPVDVGNREREVEEKLERGREARAKEVKDAKERHHEEGGHRDGLFGPRRDRDRNGPPSRQHSRPPSESGGASTPPLHSSTSSMSPTPGPVTPASPRVPASIVRPTFSFANAAAKAKGGKSSSPQPTGKDDAEENASASAGVETLVEKVAEISV